MPKRKSLTIDGVSYEIDSEPSQGGSAFVWKVRRKSDGQVFAVKKIKKDSTPGSARNRRFEQEIAYGRKVRHPNVLKIHACSDEEDFFCYVMDYYPMTLRDVIEHESDAHVLLNYALQLCEALVCVHRDGVVHRDIKPENILIDPDSRRLVLADFGIAHFKDSLLTKQKDLLVNRNYLAPEQMKRGNAQSIGKPADIFALGLVIIEMFTKQNARGRQHLFVRDRYPHLADLDLILEQMLLQDETRRLHIDTVRGLFRIMIQRFDQAVAYHSAELHPSDTPEGVSPAEIRRAVQRAAQVVLAAKYVFERIATDDLSRYNLNYHCEVAYEVSTELFNTCAQAVVYSLCKSKFDNEGTGRWDERDDALVSSRVKPMLQRDLEAILAEYPVPRGSLWEGLSKQSAHLFRFCKDYHCDELLQSIRAAVYGEDCGSLRANLIDAPVLWITRWLREYLDTDYLELSQSVREGISLEQHLSVLWDETVPLDLERESTGVELFAARPNDDSVARVLEVLEARWDVSVGELVGGNCSVMFRSRDEFLRFRKEALSFTEPGSVLEGDVLDLLRPEAEFDDLVAFSWDRDFDIAVTLKKILNAARV